MKKKDIREWLSGLFSKPQNKSDRWDRRITRVIVLGWDALLWIAGLFTGQGITVLLMHVLIFLGFVFLYSVIAKGK